MSATEIPAEFLYNDMNPPQPPPQAQIIQMCSFVDYIITMQVLVLAGAEPLTRRPLTSAWHLFPLCTMYDHSYAVLQFHCFQIPPRPFRDQQVSVSVGTWAKGTALRSPLSGVCTAP